MNTALDELEVFGGNRRRHWESDQHSEVLDRQFPPPNNSGDNRLALLQPQLLHFDSQCPQNFLLLALLKFLQLVILAFELIWRKIIHIEPVVIPGRCLSLSHLLEELPIAEQGEVTYCYTSTAFNYGLALAKQRKMAVETISHSELLCRADYGSVGAVPNEDARFAGPHEDCAVFALVDVDAGGSVEEEYRALLAV